MSETTNSAAALAPLWKRNPILRFFSSITVGMVLLALILIYASILSALPQVRGAIEVTEMEAFRHWLFVTLIALFCATLIVVTITRIRLSWINAGVWTVHTGLILLAGGAAWYFGTKIEGDVLLRSPRIQMFTIGSGNSRQVAELLAAKGENWSNTMPALGGTVSLDVVETRGTPTDPVREVVVRAKVGEGEPKDLTLKLPEQSLATISDRLAIRLRTFPAADVFYDDEVAALHYRRQSQPDSERHVAPIRGLPLHRERYLDEGYALRDVAGHESPSKRSTPEIALGPLRIPTGWFEHWRMPIPVSTPDLPFDVVVTGYVPYMRSMELAAADGGMEENPAATYTIAAGQTHLRESLFASQPGQSLSPNLNLEFRWVKSAEEQQALFAPMTGNHELTIEVVDPPVRKVVDVTEGMTIKVDGTAYEIKVAELAPNWPLMTPGFENARSPVARVDVKGPDKQYNRTVVQRYPQLSQDIDEKGTRHREGPYDPNLKLTYRTCAEGWVILAAGPNLTPQIGLFEPDGKPQVASLQVGKPSAINTTGGKLDFTLESLFAKGRALPVPIIEPLESRRPQMGREASAVRITLKGKGAAAGWAESRWIPYSNYPDAEPFAQPIEVNVPGDPATYELVYSRLPRPLDAMLIPGRLSTAFFPGRMSATSWRSEFQVADDSGAVKPAFVETNQTATIGRYTLFQSGAANDHWSYTILGVGTREAIIPQVLGCILITLGAMYAFYVKPWLRRRAAARNAVAPSAAVAAEEPAETRELAGVR